MRTTIVAVLTFLALMSTGSSGRAQTILGTGSAFAAPVYTKWAEMAKDTIGVTLNYQPLGSGVGQNQAVSGLTDFGASDVPMDPAKLTEANIFQFPAVVGGVAVFVNLPGVASNTIRLDGPVLADMFMGEIKRWDDPRIAKLNPGVTLPHLAVAPLHHASASGTTFALSRYLAKVSDTWRDKMGVGMSLVWPGGVGVRGSYGAANTVPQIAGSIAYAESSYVTANHLTTVELGNKAGKFVAPDGETFAAAVANADWGAARNFAIDLTDMPGDKSWPIVTATFVLVPRHTDKPETRAAVFKLFGWAFEHGDDAARALQYVPLTQNVKADIATAWKE